LTRQPRIAILLPNVFGDPKAPQSNASTANTRTEP
jgi:hypothetical protein